MKKRYQIDREQAVRQFHKQAEESGQELQLHLPLKEVAAALQQSVGELMRQAGLELMQLIMDNEVRQLAGEHYQRRQAEQPYRWGREQGFLVVDGQKVPIQRPRLRSDDGHEQSLGSYALFRRSEPLDDAVWDKLMLGLSTRNYSKAVREFAAAYGIEKSAVSEHFVRTSREKLRELLERPLDKLKLCVIYIDGIEFKGQHLVAALGVAMDGSKTVLGLRQGASENTTVAGELLEDLAGRGVDFSAPMLYVLDDAKALTKAVRKHAGKTAPIDVAVSFAGTERELAESLAVRVRDAGYEVFYDRFFPEQLWGKDLAVFFDDAFRKKSRFCVIFVSKQYVERDWTNHERRSAVSRLIESKGQEYILPIKVEDVELPGIQATIGYLSLKDYDIETIANLLIAKLGA